MWLQRLRSEVVMWPQRPQECAHRGRQHRRLWPCCCICIHQALRQQTQRLPLLQEGGHSHWKGMLRCLEEARMRAPPLVLPLMLPPQLEGGAELVAQGTWAVQHGVGGWRRVEGEGGPLACLASCQSPRCWTPLRLQCPLAVQLRSRWIGIWEQ
jgi:hypothetical protein